jgi:Cdc6-like AAA superfamily ATPase
VLENALETGEGTSMYIYGSPGSGKTMTVQYIIADMLEKHSFYNDDGELEDPFHLISVNANCLVDTKALYNTIDSRIEGYPVQYEYTAIDTQQKTEKINRRFNTPGIQLVLNNKQEKTNNNKKNYSNSSNDNDNDDNNNNNNFKNNNDQGSFSSPDSNASRKKMNIDTSISTIKQSDKKPKSRRKPVKMTVIIVDELDMGKKNMIAELVDLCCRQQINDFNDEDHEDEVIVNSTVKKNKDAISSVILIGLGNGLPYELSIKFQTYMRGKKSEFNFVDKVVFFQTYSPQDLVEIIRSRTFGLFEERAMNIIVTRCLSTKNGF